MLLLRWIFLLLALAFVLCLAGYTITRAPVWRQRSVLLLRWALVLGLGFVALLILRRGALVL